MYQKLKSLSGSIALKVLAALLAMGAMTATAVVLSILVFESFSASLYDFSSRLLPEMQRSATVIDRTGQLGQSMTRVLVAGSPEDFRTAAGAMREDRRDLQTEIDALPDDAIARMTPLLTALDKADGAMQAAIERRFDARDNVAEQITALGKLAENARAYLVELEDSAFFDLSIGGEETVEAISTTLTDLVEHDFVVLQDVLAARAEVNLLTGAALAMSETRDGALYTIMSDVYQSALSRYDGIIEALSASPEMNGYLGPLQRTRDSLETYVKNLAAGTTVDKTEILSLRQAAENMLSGAIDDVAFTLAVQSDDAAGANEEAIRGLLGNQVARIRDAARIESAVSDLFSTSLLGAATYDENTAVAALGSAGKALAELQELVVAAGDEELSALVTDLGTIAAGENGIVALRIAELQAQGDAVRTSVEASERLADISAAAGMLGAEAMSTMTAAGDVLVAKAVESEERMMVIAWSSFAIFLAAMLMTWALIVRPLGRVTRVTERLASGDLAPVEGFARKGGEIGRMAAALAVFRNGMIEQKEMQAQERIREEEAREADRKAAIEQRRVEDEARQADEKRRSDEHQREMDEVRRRDELTRAADAERAARAAEQEVVVSTLADALDRLASGDLSATIETEFAGGYEELRANYNAAVDNLADLIRRLSGSVEIVDRSSQEVAGAAADLARRTEASAATLEETSAAVTELSAAAKASAERALEADGIMREARSRAEQSSMVVTNAIQTMSEIESSSQSVSSIVDLIENIAFQTNLLALNAGVEAARAGEDGRGFAVVATEVRALAQRSSDAAREINDLISRTRSQIERGVSQVGEAGTALTAIIGLVSGISERVAAIAESSQEQSQGVAEIDNAVGTLDHSTQQNAAVCEETAAAGQALTAEARKLADIARRFRTEAPALPHTQLAVA